MKKEVTEEIKLRMVQAAHDLFMQLGIKSVSMDDISTRLGISKKTLYKYFPDKESLVVEVVHSLLRHSRRVCEDCTSNSQNALHELMLSVQHMYELFSHMNPSILFDLYKFYPKAYKLFRKHKEEFLLGMIRNNLNKGIREEIYRSNMNVDVIAKFRLESITIPFHPEFFLGLNGNLADAGKEIAHHFIHGIINSKGLKLLSRYLP
jgi:AcrR family transcriptional regulator